MLRTERLKEREPQGMLIEGTREQDQLGRTATSSGGVLSDKLNMLDRLKKPKAGLTEGSTEEANSRIVLELRGCLEIGI